MTQSNLDQATLIIARATDAAQKDAAAAKKLAESPAVAATIDTEGRLTLNGTASDIHLITPAKVSEAVGNAFWQAQGNGYSYRQQRQNRKQQWPCHVLRHFYRDRRSICRDGWTRLKDCRPVQFLLPRQQYRNYGKYHCQRQYRHSSD